MPEIANISAYRFAPLTDLKSLREKLTGTCKTGGLKGTILLSTEGINLFVAGDRAAVDYLVAEIRHVRGLEGLAPKYSTSDAQPFSRMLVRIKKEIIAFGVEGIAPGVKTSPKIAPRELKQWLDEGREIMLLDTRNDYEVKLGTFSGAIDLGIGNFRDFPEAVQNRIPAGLKEKTVVMFCTGGIRCEKAGPFMEREGFTNVLQLDGGILKYFEECGGAHYDGECFVFDQRVGVDPALRETESAQCFVCQSPLTSDEQRDSRYVAGVSCPYCFRSSEARMQESIVVREQTIHALAIPLPGSVPYDNRRPFLVPPECDDHSILDTVCRLFPHRSAETWAEICGSGRLVRPNGNPISAGHRVRSGERYELLQPGIIEPAVNADIRILHEDEALIVVNKPSPLPAHPSGRFHKNTLQFFLAAAYAPQRPRPAHRLDANTSGVMVWTRTRHFAKKIQPQFASSAVEKRYLARIQGHPESEDFSCHARISQNPGELGSRAVVDDGLDAHTDFHVVDHATDGTTLVEARPRTGRTNQIRIHLWHLGMPVCGDPAYLAGRKLGHAMTLLPSEPGMCLHASHISLNHPVTGVRLTFSAPPPDWA
jgi:RluA family pseudouridine synthase